MEVKILKGTNQIGGCITKISSAKGTNIIIDFGSDLSSDDKKKKTNNPNIEGLTIGKKDIDAVFISHSHGDHIDLINYIIDDIPIYVEPIAKKIYTLLGIFTHKEIKFKVKDMVFKEKIVINNDISVTPFIVDHSSYNSAMLLIEADGKRVLYTGDFRGHGTKGKLFLKTLKEIEKIDLIITEGTSLSRGKVVYDTELQLKDKATEIFKKYDQVFIMQASTNIDRICSFYKSAILSGKTFIEDIFTTNLVCSLENKCIPNPLTFKNVYTWIPNKYKGKNKSLKFKKKYVYPFKKYSKQIAYINNKYVLMVKSSMLEDIKKLYDKKHITKACLIYSMWDGYKEKAEMQYFLKEIEKYGIKKVIDLHTSGHADQMTMKLLNNLKAKKVIPIHTTKKEELKNILDNVYIANDNEIIEVK